jgi:hypothetical protein
MKAIAFKKSLINSKLQTFAIGNYDGGDDYGHDQKDQVLI